MREGAYSELVSTSKIPRPPTSREGPRARSSDGLALYQGCPKFPSLVVRTDLIFAAYFEDSFEALYGVVYRPEFEARLEDYFNTGDNDDSSWYALRNVVYATGCRAYLAKQRPPNWSDAQRRSWSYFENALSVYVDLLYTPTGLSAVRALAAMVGLKGTCTFIASDLVGSSRISMLKGPATRLSSR